MKRQLIASFALCMSSLAPSLQAQDLAYEGSVYKDVWGTVQEHPYQALPEEKVTFGSFFSFFRDKLQASSARTINDRSDILPRFQKLVHPNGICLAGTWNITEENIYSGYFKQGSKGLVIVRASVALSEIKKGQKRAFGLVGKIFPTDDPQNPNPLKTANFITIDNLAGSYAPSLLETALTNDITDVAFGPENIKQSPILVEAAKAFSFGEKVLGSLITVRQLYEVAELGEAADAHIITPQWFKVEGQKGPLVPADDFRDELRLANNGGVIRFDISVGSDGFPGGPKKWQKIGYLELTEDALAEGCDHRLHFHHPKWRRDLKHEL